MTEHKERKNRYSFNKAAKNLRLMLQIKYFSLLQLPSAVSTTSAVVETATPNGLCASYVMSPVSSGYT